MKLYRYMALAMAAAAFTACNEDPVLPPTRPFKANTSILDLKTRYWQDETNYVEAIGRNDDGEDIVIKGRVISSDQSGNIYKSLMISDGTAAITIAANVYDIYSTFAFGQEVTVKATGLKIGGYNNLMQLGGEGEFQGKPSMTFMSQDDFGSHLQGIGSANPAAVDTILTDLAELNNAKATAQGRIQWQSQLVRLDALTFENPGAQFAATQNTNVYLKDASGNRMNLRCSSYADFAKETIPSGTGSVTGILSFYGQDWQMLLIDINGLKGFDQTGGGSEPTPPTPGDAGTKEKPFTVAEAIAQNNNKTTAWVEGYIVGVMNYVEDSGNVFSPSELTTNSNIVIAASQSDYGTALFAVQLPAGDLRTALNLVDNPANLGKKVALCGSLEKYCGINGMRSTSMAVIDGTEIGSEPAAPGQGVDFTLATAIESGATYALYCSSKVAEPFGADKNYGYLPVADCSAVDGKLNTAETNAFIFTRTEKGWTIQQATDNRYLIMTGNYNSFNLSATLDNADNGYFWNITVAADGSATIVNAATSKTVQFDSQYNSYGSYPDTRGTLPVIYKK